LLKLNNSRTLFWYWLNVFYLSMSLRGVVPLQLSSCKLTPNFLRESMLSVVNPIWRCAFTHRCTWGSYYLRAN